MDIGRLCDAFPVPNVFDGSVMDTTGGLVNSSRSRSPSPECALNNAPTGLGAKYVAECAVAGNFGAGGGCRKTAGWMVLELYVENKSLSLIGG